MKLLLAGAAAAAIAVAVATPVLAAQSGEDKPSGSTAAAEHPGPKASDQGRESSDRGRAHRDAMKAWQTCVAEKGKDSCTKPEPPGHAKGHAKGAGPGPASEHGKGHGYGREHAPGQLKDKSATDD